MGNLSFTDSEDRAVITLNDEFIVNFDISAYPPFTRLTEVQRTIGLGHLFSQTTLLTDDLAFIGAPGYRRVYVFEPTAGGAIPVSTAASVPLTDGAAGSQFGAALAYDDETLVVGAPDGAGAVYVYSGPTAEWALVGEPAPLDAKPDDEFGTAVGISGAYVAVGAPGKKNGFRAQAGAVYLFTYDAATDPSAPAWAQAQKLIPPYVEDSLRFGAALSLSGSVLAVGSEQGYSYLYELAGEQWELVMSFTLYSGAVRPLVAGERIFLGFPDEDKVRLFTNHDGLWRDTLELSGAAGTAFGTALAFHGNVLAVGAPDAANENGAVAAGAVYFYTLSGPGGEWELTRTARGLQNDFHVGYSVSLREEMALVGSPGSSSTTGYALFLTHNSAECAKTNVEDKVSTNIDYTEHSVSVEVLTLAEMHVSGLVLTFNETFFPDDAAPVTTTASKYTTTMETKYDLSAERCFIEVEVDTSAQSALYGIDPFGLRVQFIHFNAFEIVVARAETPAVTAVELEIGEVAELRLLFRKAAASSYAALFPMLLAFPGAKASMAYKSGSDLYAAPFPPVTVGDEVALASRNFINSDDAPLNGTVKVVWGDPTYVYVFPHALFDGGAVEVRLGVLNRHGVPITSGIDRVFVGETLAGAREAVADADTSGLYRAKGIVASRSAKKFLTAYVYMGAASATPEHELAFTLESDVVRRERLSSASGEHHAVISLFDADGGAIADARPVSVWLEGEYLGEAQFCGAADDCAW